MSAPTGNIKDCDPFLPSEGIAYDFILIRVAQSRAECRPRPEVVKFSLAAVGNKRVVEGTETY